jgi:hypothetical protein
MCNYPHSWKQFLPSSKKLPFQTIAKDLTLVDNVKKYSSAAKEQIIKHRRNRTWNMYQVIPRQCKNTWQQQERGHKLIESTTAGTEIQDKLRKSSYRKQVMPAAFSPFVVMHLCTSSSLALIHMCFFQGYHFCVRFTYSELAYSNISRVKPNRVRDHTGWIRTKFCRILVSPFERKKSIQKRSTKLLPGHDLYKKSNPLSRNNCPRLDSQVSPLPPADEIIENRIEN